jgi:hypothetical protein
MTINNAMKGQRTMVIGRRSVSQIISALGGLLCFAGPVRPYKVTTAQELTAAAWQQVGQSIQGAMAVADDRFGRNPANATKFKHASEPAKI